MYLYHLAQSIRCSIAVRFPEDQIRKWIEGSLARSGKVWQCLARSGKVPKGLMFFLYDVELAETSLAVRFSFRDQERFNFFWKQKDTCWHCLGLTEIETSNISLLKNESNISHVRGFLFLDIYANSQLLSGVPLKSNEIHQSLLHPNSLMHRFHQ